jgi:hypothetical protein
MTKSTGMTALVPLRSPTGAALMTATVLASGVASYDANVVKIAVPARTVPVKTQQGVVA